MADIKTQEPQVTEEQQTELQKFNDAVIKKMEESRNPETGRIEIVGVDSTDFSEEMGIAPIGEEWIKKYKQAGGTGHMTANMRNLVLTVDGMPKISYARIIIRKKQ